MNQEPNNNLENTQTNLENTQVNVANTEPSSVPTQSTVEMAPVSDVTEELDLPTAAETSQENTETLQPAIEPTVNVSAPLEEQKIEVDTKPHDVPIPDESNKKDFVIKSKKETVAEDVKAREAKIEEHIKQANANYVPNSKFRNVLLVIFLVFIIAFTIFLPEIHNFIAKWQGGNLKDEEEVEITSGVLSCDFKKSSNNLDYEYIVDFRFSNKKLHSYVINTTITGDATLDMEALNTLKENCSVMSAESEKINGITVRCESKSNSIKEVESIELKNYKTDSITEAFTEAGGTFPDYTYQADITNIEKNMNAAGYNCDRIAD